MRQDPELAFQRTVSRRLVHRAAVAEVFVTDAVVLGEDHFLVGSQWPRDHALYHPDAHRRSDPLLFAETIRQALVYLAHWHYGVPLTHRFVGYDTDFEITDPGALHVGGRPMPVELEARWHWTDNRPPRRYGARLEVRLSVAGRTCGRGSLRVVAVDERSYRILRRRSGAAGPGAVMPVASPQRLEPGPVGRLRAKDSVLAPGPAPDEWQLRVDLDHAILFDHPTDHLPVMVLLEGFRQLGHLLTHDGAAPQAGPAYALVAAAVDCLAWGELDVPTRLVVREDVTGPGTPGVLGTPGTPGAPGVQATPGEPAERRLRFDAIQADTLIATCGSVWAPVQLEAAEDQPCGVEEKKSGLEERPSGVPVPCV
ncbi:ScbA/BarX family gamma-butyrolactone biosynthesis protein [Streptomyces formicae]|uniref:ScbA/BarX family gamma-butyrolactone biosynthesis protein n=1 Tax=Streptomyces formicae TaxID=1616117 RepID=UPI001F568451|nr:ScbA/BarX family gamma-butyrolactone biosynthesis protein [Streptomyces formicae]